MDPAANPNGKVAPKSVCIACAVCAVAAVITMLLMITGGARVNSGDVLVLVFAVGPYLALGLVAWWQRRRATASRVVLGVAFVLSVGGLLLLGLDSYQYHTIPHHRMVQRMAVLVVPGLQWVVVTFVALSLLVRQARCWVHRSR